MINNRSDEKNKFTSNAVIKVIGVGGGGGNALNTMIESGLTGVEFIAANTDVQALHANLAPIKIQLGKESTKGLGAGANPETGRNAALEDKAILQEVLSGADMVFVTGGMGGGTGTGAAPIIAQTARELGALTVGVVTKPFIFEGKRRKQQSEMGIQALRQSVDTLITIPNQRLLSIAPTNMSMLDGFKLADEVLLNAVKGISDIINIPGRVNVDFADVKTIMSEMGMALMGIGSGNGQSRAADAARNAINSPLLEEIDIEGATGILINITGSSSMTLHEISEASTLIQEAAHEDANIIFGAVIDESMADSIRVTVIATGFDQARIAYPEQNFTTQNQQNHFMHNGLTANPSQNFGNLGNPRPMSANNANPFAQKQNTPFNQNTNMNYQNNSGNLFGRSNNNYQTNSNQNFANNNYQNQNQIPITKIPDVNINSRQNSYNNLNNVVDNSKITSPSSSNMHNNSQNRNEEEMVKYEVTEPVLETRVGATVTEAVNDQPTLDNETQEALNLANDLARNEPHEPDFDTPAYMRRKDNVENGL